MRYALVLAGGTGTRLWPMSREALPKQLIPFINGKSLLKIAFERLEGLVDNDKRYICAGLQHEAVIRKELGAGQASAAGFGFIGEPEGRDTLNAIALSCAVISARDPEAVIAVVTADHLIEPADRFRGILGRGYMLAESNENTIVTFGMKPTHAATGFGYLELGPALDAPEGKASGGNETSDARAVTAFKEKPDMPAAENYIKAGPDKYLWNGGMFVWRASTFLRLCEQYAPENHAGIMSIVKALGGAGGKETLSRDYGKLKKISVDYAIMEPASRDKEIVIASIMMDLSWLDVGSWPAFGETCGSDARGNSVSGCNTLFVNASENLVVSSEREHLVAALGCENLIIIHTADATLVCPKNKAEDIKRLQAEVKARFGGEFI